MELMEQRIKHLEFVQLTITRMATNSFFVKGWSVTLISALLALASKESDRRFIIIAYLPVVMFWLLDGYFLSQERLFRILYDGVRTSTTSVDFSLNTSPYKEAATTWPSAIFSRTLLLFHGVLFLTVLIAMFWLCSPH